MSNKDTLKIGEFMKRILSIIAALFLAVIMTACINSVPSVPSAEITHPVTQPPKETIATVEPTAEPSAEQVQPALTASLADIDVEIAAADWQEELTNPDFFPYVIDCAVKVDNANLLITFTAALMDSTNAETAAEFADTMIRRYQSCVSLLGGSFESATKDYYGGLYDEYNISIGVAPISYIDDVNKWWVHMDIPKGSHYQIPN